MSTLQYSRLSPTEFQLKSPELRTQETPKFTPKHRFWAWTSTIWPLALHCIVAIAITILVTCYVNGRHFNLTDRKPWVPLTNGARIQLSRYEPLQSDVTTLLSSTLVVLRLVAAAWASSLSWRSAFFLMERPGLKRRDLDWMISFGFFTPPAYLRDVRIFNVGVILLATLSAQAVSPLLTGSIAWLPSNRLARPQSDATVTFRRVENSSTSNWESYIDFPRTRETVVRVGAGYVSLAWGRSVEKDVMKRTIQATAGLNINSTVANATLPYFSVTSLEWIPDPLNTLTPDQLNITRIHSILSAYGAFTPLQRAVGAFIPDAPWNGATSLPSPSIVSETRTLVMQTNRIPMNKTCSDYDSPQFGRSLPTMGFLLHGGQWCHAFARVTFTAGASACTNCRISSTSTIQNDTSLLVQEDRMTTEALRLMADLSVVLVQMNSSIPDTMNNINDYVIGLLTRSYSGIWNGLTDIVGSPAAISPYTPSLPSLQARVDLTRVYVWLSMQLLVTLCGAYFLFMQTTSQYRLVGSTTLAAFELDATAAMTHHGSEQLKAGGLLKIVSEGGRVKVVIETTKSVMGGVQVGPPASIGHMHSAGPSYR